MIKLHNYLKLIGSLCFLFILTGCWDQTDVEKQAYVLAIGLDKLEDTNKLKITYLISNPQYDSQQQGGSGTKPSEIFTFEAPDITVGGDIANAIIPQQVTYNFVKHMIVSEELAKDKDFIKSMYDTTKLAHVRRDLTFTVTKESASSFISNIHSIIESRPHKFLDLKVKYGYKLGVIPNAMLLQFFRIFESNADLFLAIYASNKMPDASLETDHLIAGDINTAGSKNHTQFAGAAVFKKGKMVGKLNGEEMQLTILLSETLKGNNFFMNFPDPFEKKETVTTTVIQRSKPKVKIDLNKNEINVHMPLVMNVLTDHSMTNYNSKKNRDILKKSIEDDLTKKYEALFKKTQEKLKGQPFGWSLLVRKEFSTFKAYEDYNWMEKYPDIKITFSTTVEFDEFGRQKTVPNLEDLRK